MLIRVYNAVKKKKGFTKEIRKGEATRERSDDIKLLEM